MKVIEIINDGNINGTNDDNENNIKIDGSG
jgi:hypothetical protein